MATKTLQSLERGIDLLFLFSEEKPTLSLEDLSQALKLPESTAYRLAATLCKKGVLTRSASGKGYELHASLLRLLAVVRAHIDIGSLALPSLEALARESGETSQLCLLQGNEVVCAEAVCSTNTIRFMPEKGRPVPLHTSALGRAVLAFLPEKFPDQVPPAAGSLRRNTIHRDGAEKAPRDSGANMRPGLGGQLPAESPGGPGCGRADFRSSGPGHCQPWDLGSTSQVQ